MSVLSRTHSPSTSGTSHRAGLPTQRTAPGTTSPSTPSPRRTRWAAGAAGLVLVAAAAAGTWAVTDPGSDPAVTAPGISSTEVDRDAAQARRGSADRLPDRLRTEQQRDAARAGFLTR